LKKLLLIFGIILGGTVWAQQGVDTFKNLIGEISKLPIYRDGRLQTFVYSRQTQRHADRLELNDPIIDLIKKDVDVESIKYLDNYQPYALDAPLPEILAFWAGMLHSDGIIKSDKAFVDIDDQYAYGKERVYFRSPMMDLNGVGFRAYFKERNVTVESQVEIRIRMGGDMASAEKAAEPVRAFGDSLYIDFDKEIAILKDHVKVLDHRFILTCDRLEVDMRKPPEDGGADRNAAEKNEKGTEISLDSFGGNAGVSKVSCFGNVKIERILTEDEKKNGDQTATSGQAVYNVKKGEIILSGDRPVMRRGEDSLAAEEITIWRDDEKLRGERNCQIVMRRQSDSGQPMAPTIVNSEFLDMDMAKNLGVFLGNVRVTDEAMQLNCHRMELTFADKEKEKTESEPKQPKPASTDALSLDSSMGGGKEIAAVKCTGDVIVVRDGDLDSSGRRGPSSYSTSGQLDYNTRTNVLVLTRDNPTLKRAEDSVTGDKITVWVDERKMEVDTNSRIQTASGADADGKKLRSYIKSDFSDLNYGKGLLTFTGNVEVRDEKLNLDCGKMIVYLIEEAKKDAAPAKKANLLGGDNPLNALGSGGGKELEKIYCEQDVKVDDPKGYLTCDYLTVYFEPVEKKKPAPAKDESVKVGNREIAKLVSVGNVHFRGKDVPKDGSAEPPKGQGLASRATFNSSSQVKADRGEIDFRKNFGYFDGNVKMFDATSGLTCNKMDFYLKNFKELPPPKTVRRVRDTEQTTMPEQVGLGFGKELEKIVCLRNVGLARVQDKSRTSALGDYGEYIVTNKRFDLLASPGNKVKLRNNAQETLHDIVQYWPESGMVSGRQGVVSDGRIPPGTF
jgi:lipopolysaccharide export system protein LptA